MSSDLSTTPDGERRARIVEGAMQAFVRFGYRRATMADIAAAAGISRPLLYTVFPGKAAVFRALAEMLLADAADASEAAWPAGAPLAAGLAAAILAKDLAIHRLLAQTPHAAEILAETVALTDDLHQASAARFRALTEARLRAAGDPAAADTARMIANAADGLKHAGVNEATYIADVERMARLVAAGIGAVND
jgi:AcrR family transcriptional regulator